MVGCAVSEYAKRWVSPHWERFILEAHGHFLAPQIEVMNPTPDDARVDVKWFLDDGSLHSTITDTIAPRNSAMLVPSGDNRGQGWAHIVSDQPVALSGSTPT